MSTLKQLVQKYGYGITVQDELKSFDPFIVLRKSESYLNCVDIQQNDGRIYAVLSEALDIYEKVQ